MVVFNFAHHNYQSLLQNLASQLKVTIENNAIIIPENIGNGIIRVIVLPNGLQTLLVKITFNKDVQIKSGNTNPGDYVLNFDEAEIVSNNSESIINSFVRLTGSSFRHWETVKKNSSIQYVKILFSKEWLSKYIGLREKISVFEKYIPFKSNAADKEKLDDEYRRIINEIWDISTDDPLQNIYYNNRILLLIEQFFVKVHADMLTSTRKSKLSADDMVKLKKVETLLHSPGKSSPEISAIAKKIGMPQTKLSQSFKQVYGKSIYNYYQVQRMQKAHELLTSGDLSVKDVSEKLGYTNLSNFILSFKKNFNISPKSLLE